MVQNITIYMRRNSKGHDPNTGFNFGPVARFMICKLTWLLFFAIKLK